MISKDAQLDDAEKHAELILKLSNARGELREIVDNTDFLKSIPSSSLIRMQDHLMDAQKSIMAAVASMKIKETSSDPDAGGHYSPGSGEYNDMMFGESPDY